MKTPQLIARIHPVEHAELMSESEILQLNEDLVYHILRRLKALNCPRPSRVYTYGGDGCYGSDKPTRAWNLQRLQI